MVSRDYTKELGLESGTRRVPWPVAAAVLAVVAGAFWFGITQMNAGAKAHAAQHADAAPPAAKTQAHN